ncbi:unnamed protein product [Oppiella nova]|uniref:Uncharacterized protein n=1 Tax=Oppiella nova TaxID=334625 RepID=A0A7R9LGQ0_9ACAR|nr:unnamed protein product [Oppiella nova]CAG2163513.1 unnamed protein product [Oppiella nova]
MNEIIKGMAVIKMYAWEKHFSKLISEARKKEMAKIRGSTLLRALNISISIIAARVILFAIFIVYVLLGGQLKAETVFVTMSIFNTIRNTMTWFFPQSIALAAEIYVSCQRVQRFLLLEEIENQSIEYKDNDFVNEKNKNNMNIYLNNMETIDAKVDPKDISIRVDEMSAKWNPDVEMSTLKNITCSVNPGELLAVIGPVGSGKSSFLMSLMNEIEVTSGSVEVNGSIAYASQESWSFNSSILQNIMFGKPYDSKKWREVISVCAMNRDLKLFPFGEKTLVGERGVSLSGGQKARITLARALYNDADIYLLDDPLSAVDSEVAKHIFEKCITDYLKSKTVVLVTHQIQFIKKATKILVLKDGRPLAFGSYDELNNSGIDFMSLISEEKTENEKKKEESKSEELLIAEQIIARKRTISTLSTKSDVDVEVSAPKLEDETKASGSIDAKVYADYIRAGAGPVLLTMAILSTLISQGLFHYSDIWLSDWTNAEDARNISLEYDQTNNIIIYSVLVATTFVTLIIRSGTFFMMCVIASVNLHNSIFYRLMRAPIAFFDNNPVGRILNRFTKDVGIVDEQLPLCSYDLNIIVTQLIGTIIVVALVNWYLIFPALVLIFFILQIRWLYIKTGRDLKRYENMARSPMYNHMTTTLNGLATIRAFKAQHMFMQQYYRYQNDHTSTYFMCFSASRALGLPGGSAGLAFTMALGLTGMTQWGVRQSAEVENQMTSVERILEYSRLTSEAELESVTKPALDWPQEGRIQLKDVYLTYENSPKPTLINLNCIIRGGEKVGVVGRTGAGKSSILAALFRMHEIEGNIIIDGIDCKSIGLHDLRKKMSIIPQDPIAFIGSLRKNLDPFDEHSEDKIWDVLAEVQLKEAVNEMPGRLDYQLSESGGNLSVGQRQLICLARAILRRNRILVLDEATANVDHKTDSLIQRTIRENFADCTVITIAHRLNTIIDSDRVLVLDAGRVIEFDRPYLLLQNNTGMFYKLVKQTGIAMASDLFRAAKEAFDKTSEKHSIEDTIKDNIRI